MYQLCPSILSADLTVLGEQIKTLEKEGLNGFILMLWMVILYRVFLLGMPVIKSIRKESKLFFVCTSHGYRA